MPDLLRDPWPWYVSGPLLGLMVPLLFLVGGKRFGLSSSMRHLCAAVPAPRKPAYLRYDWRRDGGWNLLFVLGIVLGAALSTLVLGVPDVAASLAPETVADLSALGVSIGGFVPDALFSWSALGTPAGLLMVVGGGFFVGFGARYADGCTSGHAISGLATFQAASLVAVLGFFAGGLLVTYVLLPLVLR